MTIASRTVRLGYGARCPSGRWLHPSGELHSSEVWWSSRPKLERAAALWSTEQARPMKLYEATWVRECEPAAKGDACAKRSYRIVEIENRFLVRSLAKAHASARRDRERYERAEAKRAKARERRRVADEKRAAKRAAAEARAAAKHAKRLERLKAKAASDTEATGRITKTAARRIERERKRLGLGKIVDYSGRLRANRVGDGWILGGLTDTQQAWAVRTTRVPDRWLSVRIREVPHKAPTLSDRAAEQLGALARGATGELVEKVQLDADALASRMRVLALVQHSGDVMVVNRAWFDQIDRALVGKNRVELKATGASPIAVWWRVTDDGTTGDPVALLNGLDPSDREVKRAAAHVRELRQREADARELARQEHAKAAKAAKAAKRPKAPKRPKASK